MWIVGLNMLRTSAPIEAWKCNFPPFYAQFPSKGSDAPPPPPLGVENVKILENSEKIWGTPGVP